MPLPFNRLLRYTSAVPPTDFGEGMLWPGPDVVGILEKWLDTGLPVAPEVIEALRAEGQLTLANLLQAQIAAHTVGSPTFALRVEGITEAVEQYIIQVRGHLPEGYFRVTFTNPRNRVDPVDAGLEDIGPVEEDFGEGLLDHARQARNARRREAAAVRRAARDAAVAWEDSAAGLSSAELFRLGQERQASGLSGPVSSAEHLFIAEERARLEQLRAPRFSPLVDAETAAALRAEARRVSTTPLDRTGRIDTRRLAEITRLLGLEPGPIGQRLPVDLTPLPPHEVGRFARISLNAFPPGTLPRFHADNGVHVEQIREARDRLLTQFMQSPADIRYDVRNLNVNSNIYRRAREIAAGGFIGPQPLIGPRLPPVAEFAPPRIPDVVPTAAGPSRFRMFVDRALDFPKMIMEPGRINRLFAATYPRVFLWGLGNHLSNALPGVANDLRALNAAVRSTAREVVIEAGAFAREATVVGPTLAGLPRAARLFGGALGVVERLSPIGEALALGDIAVAGVNNARRAETPPEQVLRFYEGSFHEANRISYDILTLPTRLSNLVQGNGVVVPDYDTWRRPGLNPTARQIEIDRQSFLADERDFLARDPRNLPGDLRYLQRIEAGDTIASSIRLSDGRMHNSYRHGGATNVPDEEEARAYFEQLYRSKESLLRRAPSARTPPLEPLTVEGVVSGAMFVLEGVSEATNLLVRQGRSLFSR